MLDYTLNGHQPERMGNHHEAAVPHGAYPCQGEDRWCTIACLTDAHWQALCQVMGQPAWCQEARFATLQGRKAHEEDLEAHLRAWTQGWQAETLMHTLQQAGVPAGVVHTNQGLTEDPQLQHRGHFVYMQHVEMGHHAVQRSEFRLSAAAAEHRWPSPLIGEHTIQVCQEILGMADAEMQALLAEGVLEDSTPWEGGAA